MGTTAAIRSTKCFKGLMVGDVSNGMEERVSREYSGRAVALEASKCGRRLQLPSRDPPALLVAPNPPRKAAIRAFYQ